MRTIRPAVFNFLASRSRTIATLITLSLLLGFALWSVEWNVKVKAAPTPQGSASGFLYVLNECIGCDNRIFGFAVDESTGALTPLTSGFPVSTGGKGTNSFTSELLTIDRNNLRLFAVNAASNTVSSFAIDPATGALTAMFSPLINLNDAVAGGGVWNSIAAHPSCFDTLLVVGDHGIAGANTGHLASFKITATTATLAGSSETGTAHPLSTAFSQNGRFVYTGGGFGNQFAGFGIDANGALNPLANGVTFGTQADNPAAYAMDAKGRLFMANRPFHQLCVFTTTAAGLPTLAHTLSNDGIDHAGHGVLHPNGQFYVVSDKIANPAFVSGVGVYKINDTTNSLTQVTGSPFASGSKGVNLLAFNGAGTFLFAGNVQTRNLTTFQVDATSGAMTILGTQPTNTLGVTGVLTGIAYLPPSTGPAKTTTTTAINAPAITFGQDGKIIVTVTTEPPGISLSGNVSLSVDGGPPVTLPLLADGSATFPIDAPPAGNHSLAVNFLPGQDCFAASGATGTLVVNDAETSTNIVPPPIRLGQNGRVTINVSSQFLIPSGNVTLRVDGGAVRTQALSSGSATFEIIQPSLGLHTLRATFPPQGGFKGSSDVDKLVVRPPLKTVTRIKVPAVTLGLPPVQTAPVTVKVTSSSFPFVNAVGSVTLSIDNHAAVTEPLSGGSAVFHIVVSKVGLHFLRARFATQAGFAASNATRFFIIKGDPGSTTTRTGINGPTKP